MRYLFFCLLFINSCKEDDKFNIDKHLILLAYLDLENKEISEVSEEQLEHIINTSNTKRVRKNIYLTKIDYGGDLSLASSWKQIYYLHDQDSNFKFAFGSADELCYHHIRETCNHPLFESRYLGCLADSRMRIHLNYILKELGISDIETAKQIVREFMPMRIDSLHHLQLQKTRRYLDEGYIHLDSIKTCCQEALEQLEKNFNSNFLKNTDLFESQFRGIWKIDYIESEGQPIQIADEYLLLECMPVHPAGFTSYREAIQTDGLLQDNEGGTK